MRAPVSSPSTCEKSPTGAHHRIIQVVLGVEEQTCKHCGDTKERAAVEEAAAIAFSQATWLEKAAPPPPHGYHWGM